LRALILRRLYKTLYRCYYYYYTYSMRHIQATSLAKPLKAYMNGSIIIHSVLDTYIRRGKLYKTKQCYYIDCKHIQSDMTIQTL
ncbi:hypothetical protein XELAEV_18030747mg, partial [Xenopus laevis]